jgi:hypothetical protein
MTNEEGVLAALDKPSGIYSLKQRLDPSSGMRPACTACVRALEMGLAHNVLALFAFWC